MRQYLLSIYQPDGVAPPPEALEKVMREMGALIGEMKSAGVWVFNAGLHPPGTATVVRTRRDDVLVTDGPYAEGKEHIGGFLIINAPDLDAALEWGGKLARVVTLDGPDVEGGLPIEIRPMQGAEH
jgi:hypothetical protein